MARQDRPQLQENPLRLQVRPSCQGRTVQS
jgi:hypothetical protein